MKLSNISVLFLIQLATSSVIIRGLEPWSRELHSRSSSGDVDILRRKSKRSSSSSNSKKRSKKRTKKRTKKRKNKKTKKPTSDIVETALAAGIFNTLVAALTAADLVETLSAPNGPYTVFAPTDDAFGLLPNGMVECLLKPENVDPLTSILLYHVVSGQVLSSALSDGQIVATLNGEDVIVDLSSGVKINQSTVIAADVLTSNGVIHIIDAVLVPPSIDVEAFLATC